MSLDLFISILDMTKDNISELENFSIEISQIETQKEKEFNNRTEYTKIVG